MNAGGIIWLASPVMAYLAVVVFGVVWFRRARAHELHATRPVLHRVLLAAYLALVFSPPFRVHLCSATQESLKRIGSNQPMKPTPKEFASGLAPLQNKFRVIATTPWRGLSLSR